MSFVAELERLTPELMTRDGLPGAAIALIENATPTVVRCWGNAGKGRQQAVTRNTLFNVASISKAFTSWGIMRLVEQGRLDLDRPAENYLGGWRLPASHHDHELITTRRLLSHTAGISTEGVKGVDPSGPGYTTIDVLAGRLPGLDEYQRQYCQQWGTDPERGRDPVSVKYPPGETFHYSNLGFTVLQLLIEEVTGSAFEHFMQKEILRPLGMASASFTLPDTSNRELATAFAADGSELPTYRHVALAAAGLYCSIDDLAHFACAELNEGATVISPRSIQTLFERQCFAETMEGMDFDSALGHYRLESGDRTFVHHTGGVPGWRSVYGIVPQTGHGFCALINSDGGNQFWMELLQAWFETI